MTVKILNLLEEMPKSQRKFDPNWRTDTNRKIARRFDKEFFDGDRANGYGGYYYDGRWKKIAKKLQSIFNLNKDSAVLDIGCAKGFLLYDLQELIPGIKVAGIDVSEYALNNAMDGFGSYMRERGYKNWKNLEEIARNKVLPFMIKGSADNLPYVDNSFDLVLSINTTHNLPKRKFRKAIKEMIRVSKDKESMFIQLDSYSTPNQKKAMDYWNLTGLTVMSDSEWIKYLEKLDYNGYFFGTKFDLPSY